MSTRREFIKTSLAASAAATTVLFPGCHEPAPASTTPAPATPAAAAPAPAATVTAGGVPDLITVRGEDRAAMLDRALQAFGGIGAFVKKGQKVVVKPNIGWDRRPELGANTHPDIVGRLVTLCLEAGASEVAVFDNTCDQWEKAYKTSGIEAAAKAAGARVFPAHDTSYYRDVAVPAGVSLKTVKIHAAILDCDVFINAPVLKHHSGSTMSACIKNLMGIIANADRKFYHANDLHQCVADILSVKKPHLNILDAFSPMTRNGPKGNSTNDLDTSVRQLLVSTDIVAIDAAASRILGHAEDGIKHVRIAADAGYGSCELAKLKIERVTMQA